MLDYNRETIDYPAGWEFDIIVFRCEYPTSLTELAKEHVTLILLFPPCHSSSGLFTIRENTRRIPLRDLGNHGLAHP